MSTLNDLMQRSGLPQLEARMLMQYATGWSRVSLISRGLDELPVVKMQLFSDLVGRRLSGEPMAYIIGVREFYGRDFKVNPNVLIPRPDTETLIEWVLNECHLAAQQPLEVLDLGVGSGAIAVTLACERPARFKSHITLRQMLISCRHIRGIAHDQIKLWGRRAPFKNGQPIAFKEIDFGAQCGRIVSGHT